MRQELCSPFAHCLHALLHPFLRAFEIISPTCSVQRSSSGAPGAQKLSQPSGTSIVFISHKLNEVLDISDRVTVLRRGEKIDTVVTEGSTERSLARLMVGRDVLLRVEKPEHKVGEPLLQVKGVSALDDRELPAVDDVSFEVRAGEIVAIAGVDANGQSELIEVLTGLRRPTAGTVIVNGKDVTSMRS